MASMDDIANNAIINFKDLKSKQAETKPEEENVEEEKQVEAQKEPQMSAEKRRKLVQMKVTTAKMYGAKEIKEYEKAVNEFLDKLDNLVMFREAKDIAEDVFKRQILDGYINPVFKGQVPYGVPDFMFKKIRTNMFKDLIKEYVDKNEKKK